MSSAALKFFLGQEASQAGGADSDEDGDDDDGPAGKGGSKAGSGKSGNMPAPAAPSREEVYKAMHKVMAG